MAKSSILTPRFLLLILLVGGLAFIFWRVAGYFALPESIQQQIESTPFLSSVQTPLNNTSPVDWKTETVASNLTVPWSLIFPTPESIIFTERTGAVRLIQAGQLQSAPLYHFVDVRSNQEQGLMGLALHPDFATNGWIYACVSLPEGDSFQVKIARLKADNPQAITRLDFDQDILRDIQAARVHAGCALAFGPDKKLYISTGDATQRGQAKDPHSLVGKILRVNDDGSRPDDNPIANSLTYSYGHRNPQGLAWHANGSLYETEHGPSVFDGPAGGDEVNRILPGEFYGWPDVSHEKTQAGARSPLVVFTPAEAPASLLAYSGKMFPQFRDNLFFGALRGTGIWRLVLDPDNPDTIVSKEKLFAGEFGRIRGVFEGPDGAIYFTTSNRDGRGTPSEQDDRILRFVPAR